MKTKIIVVCVAIVTTVALSLGFAAANRRDAGISASPPRLSEAQTTPMPPIPTVEPAPMPPSPPELAAGDFEVLTEAKGLVAKVLGVRSDDLSVSKIESVASSDGIPVPEYLITLEYNGRGVQVRGRPGLLNLEPGTANQVLPEIPAQLFTPVPFPGGSVPGGLTPPDLSPTVSSKEGYIDLAKADLAAKIGVSRADISVVNVESVEWSDTSLGAPKSGEMYAQIPVSGYKIVLKAGASIFEYHGGSGRVVEANK